LISPCGRSAYYTSTAPSTDLEGKPHKVHFIYIEHRDGHKDNTGLDTTLEDLYGIIHGHFSWKIISDMLGMYEVLEIEATGLSSKEQTFLSV